MAIAGLDIATAAGTASAPSATLMLNDLSDTVDFLR